MILSQIKYSYIPKSKPTEAIISSLGHILNTYGEHVNEFRLIDNKLLGARIYPKEIQESVIRVTPENIKETIVDLAKDEDIDVIIINGFDIELDEIKKEYCDIVDKYKILLCINKIIDCEMDTNISVIIDTEVKTLDEEEWQEVKADMLESLEESVEQQTKGMDTAEDRNQTSNDSTPKSVKDLLNILSAVGYDDLYDDNDEDIEEMFSHSIGDSDMTISVTTNNNVSIDIDGDYVMIPKEHLPFLIKILSNLI